MSFEAGFIDNFTDDRPVGKVIGRANPNGITRQGSDVEGVIGIDHGALRIQPLIKPGWGRSGIAYGPFQRENGLAFAAVVLNGHNTSQTGDLADSLPRRLYRWARSSDADPVAARLLQWVKVGDKKTFIRQLRRWTQIAWDHRRPGSPEIDENLAVGWLSQPAPENPAGSGNTLVVHATGAENGELWARSGPAPLPVFRGLQNIPVLYLVVLREKGAAYYVSSLPNARGTGAFPHMRPVAVDWQDESQQLYGGVYQSVLGQIGFRVDTRVYSTQAARIPGYEQWYGSAHTADLLRGQGTLDGSQAEIGGGWNVRAGNFTRTSNGAQANAPQSLAQVDPGTPSGLIHMLIEPGSGAESEICLLWRVQDEDNYLKFRAGSAGCCLDIKHGGDWSQIAVSEAPGWQAGSVNALQILDDGNEINITINGQRVFANRLIDPRLSGASGIGLLVPDPHKCGPLRAFEAHPRTVPVPPTIALCLPDVQVGTQVLVCDNFAGPYGDLAGRKTETGGKEWRKEIGLGSIELTGSGFARVKASVAEPCPGRTAYTVEWPRPAFADVQVLIDPPGSQRGQGEKGRGGLIFWQDAENYIIVSTWLDDIYDGTSISSFFYLNGFEELYDAVWTNVGRRVEWGRPYNLRVSFDGLVYIAFVDDEPVLYRSLTDVYPHVSRLAIHRVGIVANWEWGNDTGSSFRQFRASGKG